VSKTKEKIPDSWMPKHLTAPTQWLWWEIEEFIPLAAGLCLTVITKSLHWPFVGFFLSSLVKKFKSKTCKGFLTHIFYITGLSDLEGYPPGLSKKFYE
jgi:type IV conjugative transfer system protein TraL